MKADTRSTRDEGIWAYDPTTGEITPYMRPDNLRHWDALSITDPKHTKPFQRPGGFRGTAIRPIWNQYRLTEHFGPIGEGWGSNEPEWQLVTADAEILVFCTLRCWYKENGQVRYLTGVGGDKVLAKTPSGLRSDDEAFKKAFTDAIGNAFQRLGVSADIHMGLFENSKYVEDARQRFETAETETKNDAPVVTPPVSRGNSPPPIKPDIPGPPQDEARQAYRSIHAAISASATAEMLVRMYDPNKGKWNAAIEKQFNMVEDASPTASKRLMVHYWDRLNKLTGDIGIDRTS